MVKSGTATRCPPDRAQNPASFEVVGDPAAVSDAFIEALARLLIDAAERDAAEPSETPPDSLP